MFDPQKLLGSIVGQAMGGVFGGKKGRKQSAFSTGDIASKATLGLGALGIAIAAYEHFKQKPENSAPLPPPPARPTSPPVYTATATLEPASPSATIGAVPPPPPAARDISNLSADAAEAVLLVRTMIAAAAADGVIDAEERSRILSRSVSAGLDADTRGFLEAELAVPKSADEIAALTAPALVNEVYAAALLAVNLDHESERRFLERLGKGLGLSAETQQEIQSHLLT